MRVRLDPQALGRARRGHRPGGRARSTRGNVNLPTGVLWGPDQALTIRADGQLENAEGVPHRWWWRPATARRCGSAIVGDVVDDVENTRATRPGSTAGAASCSRSSASPAPTRWRWRTPCTRWSSRLRPQLPALGAPRDAQRPLGLDPPLGDRRADHAAASRWCWWCIVIFLFLRNLSATLIPSLALPFSIVGTFAVMKPLGFSLDNLSLMALTLAVGFVVDDAIVMLENIVRHLEMGKRPMQAALDGAREIGFTILSMTISLVAVFIPVLFMGGLLGRLFHEFAVVIGVAILVSGFVSLTLTPDDVQPVPQGADRDKRHGTLLRAASSGVFQRSLALLREHARVGDEPPPRSPSLFSLAILIGTVGAVHGWCPRASSRARTSTRSPAPPRLPEGTSFDSMVRHQQAVAAIVQKDPERRRLHVVGGRRRRRHLINQGRIVCASSRAASGA